MSPPAAREQQFGHSLGARVDKWPKCYSDRSKTVADELRNECVAELSFPLGAAEAFSAGATASGYGRTRIEMAAPLKPREPVPIKQ
jgi:hypothetical protein